MQQGGDCPLLSLLKRVSPMAPLFLVCAEEEPPVQLRSEPGARIKERFLSLLPAASRRAEACEEGKLLL